MNTNAFTPSSTISTINCSMTAIPDECKWFSPSIFDRSDPNSNMLCPANMDRCWNDPKNKKIGPREFRCGACDINTHSQTENCHISMVAHPNKDTTNWSTTMTNEFSEKCKNKWRQY